MKKNIQIIGLIVISVFMLFALPVFAQVDDDGAEMATGLRSNGLIWIVVGVIVIIVGGLLVYLFRIDRKITQLEKEIKVKP
jgi:Na+/proline symporter